MKFVYTPDDDDLKHGRPMRLYLPAQFQLS